MKFKVYEEVYVHKLKSYYLWYDKTQKLFDLDIKRFVKKLKWIMEDVQKLIC
jgi:hypothetical protein